MNLTFGYQLHPGQCISCGSSDPTRKVIDWSVEDLAHIRRSHVYTCELCVAAAYAKLEPTKVLIEAADLAAKDGQIMSLTSEVARLMEEADAMNSRIARAVAASK